MDKHEILNHLTQAHTQLLNAIEGVSATEMTTLYVSERWTVREVLAHISGWSTWDLQMIQAIRQGKTPDLSVIQDVDAFNDRLVAERKQWSMEQIVAEMENTQIAMQELVGSMSNQQLLDDHRFRGPYWENLVKWLRIAWEHEEEHAVQIQDWRKRQR